MSATVAAAEFNLKLVCKSCGKGPVIILAQLFNQKGEFIQNCWCGSCLKKFSLTGKMNEGG
jgi:hypothetical protein